MNTQWDLFDPERDCEQVDPGRFEKGVCAALTRHHAAHASSGPGVLPEAFHPLTIEGIGTVCLNENLPENQMMGGFLDAFAAKTMRERASGITRMLGLYFFIQDQLHSGEQPAVIFQKDDAGNIDGINEDVFTAAALAPIKFAGHFQAEDLIRLAVTQGQTRDEGLRLSPGESTLEPES